MTNNCWNTPFSSTNGQLLIGRASGRPAWNTITQGTGCTITNGAGSIEVAFDNATLDWELVASATASSSATIDFTGLSSTYDAYMIVLHNVQPATDGVIMYLRTSTNGGVSYDSGAANYAWASLGMNDGGTLDPEGSTGDTQISLAGDQASEELGNATNETLSGYIWVFKPSTAAYTKMYFAFTYTDLSGDQNSLHGSAARLAAADVDAIRIFMSSGNISIGNFRLYGSRA